MKKLSTEQKIRNRVLAEERKQQERKLKDRTFYWRGKSFLDAWVEAHQ